MAVVISNTGAIAMLDALLDLIETGGTATLQVYDNTSTIPTNCEASNGTNVLLGTLTFSATTTAFPGSSDANPGATVDAASITSDTSADASGTINYWRVYNGAGTCIMQGNATATGGGGDAEFNTLSVTTGDTISCTGFTINMPES